MDKANNNIKEDEILTELQSKVDTEAQQIVDKLKELAKLEDKLEKQLAMYNIQKQSTQQRIDITQEKIKEAILKNTKLEERVSSLKEKLNELESKQGQLENEISMLNEKVSEVEAEEENKQKQEIELQNNKSKLIDSRETLKDSKEGGIRKLYNEEVKKYRDLNDLTISNDNNINTDNDIRKVGLLEVVNEENETKVKDIYSSSELGLGLDLDFDLDFDYATATDLGQDNAVRTTEEELKNSTEFKPKAKEEEEKEKTVVVGDTRKQSGYEVLDTNNKIKDKDIDTDIQAEINSTKQPPLELVKEYLTNLGIDIIPTIELKNLLTQEQIEHLVEDGELYYVGTGYMLATDLGI